ncbi:GGDEF domain-containing response regulator [Oryzifoliimicrobium ureilyticus]|uniref:GGDEF domain-containing response regulator n=1 Tax=Oryzifoliimicrobium ureilyticus TaxID=3113724 RepID=UPI0030760DB6
MSSDFGFGQSIEARQELLLIEDSRMFSLVLRHRLEAELGLSVTSCSSLEELNRLLVGRQTSYRMAIVDLTLPDCPDGEALELTRQYEIPSIVFAASVNAQLHSQVLQRNVVDYVVKDNARAFDALVASVRRALTNAKTKLLVVGMPGEAFNAFVAGLRAQQYGLSVVASGKDAVNRLAKERDIDLLLVVGDQLPDMDAFELMRQLREQNPVDPTHVVGMAKDDAIAVEFLRAGANEVLHNAFSIAEVRHRISNSATMAREVRRLRTAAACDYLTGLYNRRYFCDNGPKIVGDCLRRRELSSIAILDIDHFKRLNDTYGHEIGDLVLKSVAHRLSQLFQSTGYLLCRLGGEEFAILFPMTNSKDASQLCDDVRSDISRLRVKADDEELTVTVSIGVAEISMHETFENYLHAADQFLYMAKNRGRNTVFSDTQMNSETLLYSA